MELVLLYGSETGNCEDLVKRIEWQARARQVAVKSSCLDKFDLAEFSDENAVRPRFYLFACSTTGQGDLPTNMQAFWKRIMRRTLPANALSGVNCAVIGLGDSSYLKYNFVAKKLFKRLKQLGAVLVLDLALGDDQHDHGYDAVAVPFMQQLWTTLADRFHLEIANFDDHQVDYVPRATYELKLAMCGKRMAPEPPKPPYSRQNPFPATVVSNRRATSEDHFQDVRLIKLQLTEDVKYSVGDVAMVAPQNSEQDVQQFLELTGLNDDKYKWGAHFVPEKTADNVTSANYELQCLFSAEAMAREMLDIHSVPKKSFFELFWRFSTDQLERDKLREFASVEGQEELINYCVRSKRTVVEVLADFPKTTPLVPVDYWFDLIPAIKPRAFSIASSPAAHKNELHLLVAVVSYQTRLRTPRTGLCSNYLATRKPGDVVPIWTKKGTFVLDGSQRTLIMIGPGTGVAPFRSIISERAANNRIEGDCLFFGCRFKAKDHYFEEEWRALDGKLQYFAAFSREEPTKSKVYVQHKMWEQKELVAKMLLERNCTMLIAGSSRQMPQNVREMLVRIMSAHYPDSESLVTELERVRRIQYECWS